MISVRYLLSACALLLLLIAFRPLQTQPLEIGAPVPRADLPLPDVSGREITLDAARGRGGLLVMFVAHRCPYMIRNQERIREICRYALQKQIGVVLVNANVALQNAEESFAAMKRYAAEQHYNWRYVQDRTGALAEAFDAGHNPECYLFDRNGRLAYKGAIDDNPGNAGAVKTRHLHNAIEEMTDNRPVKVAATPAPGCNIKRF